jgi:hypothetical protein
LSETHLKIEELVRRAMVDHHKGSRLSFRSPYQQKIIRPEDRPVPSTMDLGINICPSRRDNTELPGIGWRRCQQNDSADNLPKTLLPIMSHHPCNATTVSAHRKRARE